MHAADITVEISTRNRYHTTLPLALASVLHQTVIPRYLHVYEDGEHRDLRNDSTYSGLLHMMQSRGIEWRVFYGEDKGQVLNHQKCLETAETPWIFRVDDDDYLEPTVLETLLKHCSDHTVGAVSGLVLSPGRDRTHTGVASSKIEDIYSLPNSQWYRHDGVNEVDHFNNSFLYRRSAAKSYCMDLSPVGHREETIFTHEIKRGGYKLLLDPEAVIWHLRDPQGGIRSHQNQSFYDHDEAIFARKLNEWGVVPTKFKLIVMDNGMGDHVAMLRAFPRILERWSDHTILLALCYPEIFKSYDDDPRVRVISIADAHDLGANLDDFNIYKWMGDHRWTGRLHEAFEAMLGVEVVV